MKKIFKPASLLLYLLTILVFFFVGGAYVSITGAANNQGLAGGAIVLGYGVMFSFIAFLAALMIAYRAEHKTIVIINRILAILLVAAIAIAAYRFNKKSNSQTSSALSQVFFTSGKIVQQTVIGLSYPYDKEDKPMGLGFISPNFYKNQVLYFYSQPNLEKSVQEHTPTDSIVVKQMETGGFEIVSAPPWLKPEYLKLDYDIIYFRVLSIGYDFAEVIVNKQTQKTNYISRGAGSFLNWPDFLLSMNSVEFINSEKQKVKIRPLSYAGEIKTSFQFMKPQQVSENWMQVLLLDNNFRKVGQGWIEWKKDNKLLVSYSLMS